MTASFCITIILETDCHSNVMFFSHASNNLAVYNTSLHKPLSGNTKHRNGLIYGKWVKIQLTKNIQEYVKL